MNDRKSHSYFSQQSVQKSDVKLLNFLPFELFIEIKTNTIFLFYSCLLAAKGFKLKLFVLQVFPVVEGLRISHSLPGSVSLQR